MDVSIVIPMYNSKDTIKSAIESVINQTYKESIEIVVVNDGSSDGCEKIVQQLVDENTANRIIRLINKENGGVSTARNCGIKEATGEWIALLDSDDVWLPEKLEKQIEAIEENPDIKFIGTNRNGETYPFFGKSKKHIYTLNSKEIILKWYPQTSTALIHKGILHKAGLYDEARTHAEDGDLWLKINQYCDLHILNEDLVFTGGGKRSFGDSGLSANIQKMYQGEILSLKGARSRNQINILEYWGFYFWLTIKYFRRMFIVRGSK